MTSLIDKFGILSNTRFDSDIKKKNYIENYLNDNYICHHDLIKNQTLSIPEINCLLKSYLRKHKTVFSRMLRFGKTNIDIIIDFVNQTKLKFDFIKSICSEEFPDENELITNIILCNPCVDKLILSYIDEKKSIKNFLVTFNKFNSNKKIKEQLNLKISKYIIQNLPSLNILDRNLEMLWILDKYINYYLMMSKKYYYLSKDVFTELIDIVRKQICNSIIKEAKFLKYFQINYPKFEQILNTLKNVNNYNNSKKDFQNSLLFFRPNTFSELYDFINILVSMKILNKNTIIDNFIDINKNLINEENIKFITNKININIINKISNENNYQFIKNVKFNQDLILADITVFLMKRYIYFEDFDKIYENEEYNLMKSILPKNILYKYMKVINDINNTINKDYKYRNLSTIYISKPVWNFNYEKGHSECIYEFHKPYPEPSITHNVEFFLHLGEVITEFKTDFGIYNIRMLPIHYEIIKKCSEEQLQFPEKIFKMN